MRVTLVLLLLGCGDTVVCGPGTALRDGECVTATPVMTCDNGGIIIGGACFPDPSLVCGPNTKWDPVLQRCVGQMVNSECTDLCGTPTNASLCVQGRIFDFLNPTTAADPTPSSHLVVRAYDPLQFVVDPQNAPILGTSDVGANGCYKIDGLGRPTSNLIAVSVTDASNALGDTYALAGAGAPVQSNHNVNLDAYFIARTTTDQWNAQVGGDLLSAGLWIGQYLDVNNNPVAGVTPTRGEATPPGSIYCFRGDRMHLITEDTTDALGLCVISPDDPVGHSGSCPSGCTCGGSNCTPTFPSATGGSAPGVAFFQVMKAM